MSLIPIFLLSFHLTNMPQNWSLTKHRKWKFPWLKTKKKTHKHAAAEWPNAAQCNKHNIFLIYRKERQKMMKLLTLQPLNCMTLN